MSATAILLIEAGLVYPVTAAFNRTDGFAASDRSIDGLAFVAHSSEPYEYDLVNWITANVPADATIVEASGRNWGIDGNGQKTLIKSDSDYTDSARISARTGRATGGLSS